MSGGSRTRLSDAAGPSACRPVGRPTGRWCLSCSATDTQQGRKESNLLDLFWRQAALPGARPCRSAAPAGLEPAAFPLTAGSTTVVLRGNHKSGRQDLNLRSRGSEPRDHSAGPRPERQRPWWESNPRYAILQTAASPLDHRVFRQWVPRESNPSTTAWMFNVTSFTGWHQEQNPQSRRWDSNPLGPRYEGGALPVEHRRLLSIPVRSRTSPSTFARSRASATPRGCPHQAPGAGVGPTPAGSEPAVLPLDDPGIAVVREGFEPSCPQGRQVLSLGCLPFHHLTVSQEPTRFRSLGGACRPPAHSIRVSGRADVSAGSRIARVGYDPTWPA